EVRRRVEYVACLLERRVEHPVDGDQIHARHEDAEWEQPATARCGRVHARSSDRRARKYTTDITIGTTISVVVATAAVSNRENSNASLYAYTGRISVAPPGPPPVIKKMVSNVLKVKMKINRIAVRLTGRRTGIVMLRNCCQALAPSMRAASYRLGEMPC